MEKIELVPLNNFRNSKPAENGCRISVDGLINNYKKIVRQVKSGKYHCPYNEIPFDEESVVDISTPLKIDFETLKRETIICCEDPEKSLQLIEKGYLKLLKELFLQNLSVCAQLGIVQHCQHLVALSKHIKVRHHFWDPPEDNIMQALILLTLVQDPVLSEAATSVFLALAENVQEGEFDFLQLLRKPNVRDRAMNILKTTNIMYQVDFHESIFGPSQLQTEDHQMRCLQSKNEGLIPDLILIHKIGAEGLTYQDVLAMTDEQIYRFLPALCVLVRTFAEKIYEVLDRKKKKK